MIDLTAEVTRLMQPAEPMLCGELLDTINAERLARGEYPAVIQDVYRAVGDLFERDLVSISGDRWVWRIDVPVIEDTEGMLF